MNIFKNVGVVLLLIFGIVACEKDIEDIGVDLVDNGAFDVGGETVDVVAYNIDIDSSRVDNNGEFKPGYLMGVYHNDDFGYINSTLISQLRIPYTGIDFGQNPTIDKVVLDIPYFYEDFRDTIKDNSGNDIAFTNLKLDSIYGNTDIEFQIKISELETFLNTLDPEDPTQNKKYYSDRDYSKSNQIYLGNFKPNRNDTVLYVERESVIIGKDPDDGSFIYDRDTVKNVKVFNGDSLAVPSMKFILNEDYIRTKFVDQSGSYVFDSNDNFINYFKGLYIEAIGNHGSLVNANVNGGKMTIYYTNEEEKDEGDEEDLNFNGVKGEEGITINVKHEMSFSLSGVKSNKIERDYGGSEVENKLINPDIINGEDKLYVQGAAGSEAVIKLFSDESIQEIINNNWLINEANLTVYVDRDASESDDVPKRLYLYKYKTNSAVEDLTFKGPEIFGGTLEYKEEGIPSEYVPYRYKFRITKYISDLLKNYDPLQSESAVLALRSYHPTDFNSTNPLDTIVGDYSWVPRGVVLHGNFPKENDKRIRLEIKYSK
ncbi:MAG: DUF4270 domain-containing protein [Bacteroidota bacterium]